MISCGLQTQELETINSVFAKHKEIESVKIFGSRAKGNFRKNSDIDLALIGNVDFLEAEEIAEELDDLALPYFFDVQIFAAIKSPELLEHINRVGISVYTKSNSTSLNLGLIESLHSKT